MYLIACGEIVKINLIDFYGVNDNQVTVIHNAVKSFDTNLVVDSLINTLHKEGKFIVGNVGRLSKQKGMEYYLKAVPMVIRKHPNIIFLVIGSGEDEESLKKLVYKLNIQKYVRFMGYRSDIQNIMMQLDLIVLSSLWEGFPLTPIEAYSVKKTIVATAVDGTTEIVNDGIDGFLVEPKDSKAIAEKICQLIEDKTLKRKFEEKAYGKYISEFSFEKFAQKYVIYYEDI